MFRIVPLGIALAGLAAACALVEPLPPAGTVLLQLQVDNQSLQPADIQVRTPGGGRLVGAVQPPTLPPKTKATVSFYVPITGGWAIMVNDGELMGSGDMRGRLGPRNDIGIEVDARGNLSWWCNANCH